MEKATQNLPKGSLVAAVGSVDDTIELFINLQQGE